MVTSKRNCIAVLATNSLASSFLVENSSGLTQNLETLVKESDADENADTQLKNLVLKPFHTCNLNPYIFVLPKV